MTRFKSAVCNLGVLLSSIVILALAFEAGLAILRINTKSSMRFIPEGTTYIPHAYYRHTKEGFSEGYFNSHGFRDYERTYEKAANTFRILVFGDSYVEALQVALSDAFPALLEKRLNENSTAIRFEVLNLGQSGFGTADEYMRYVNFGVKYAPDLVILALLTGNDFQDNSKFFSPESHLFYFVFDKNYNLVLDRSVIDNYQRGLTRPKRLFQYLAQKSYLVNLISERLYLLREQIRTNRFKKHFAEDSPTGMEQQLDEFNSLNIYLPDPSEHWKEAFDLTKELILKFRDAVEEHGARFVLVTLSNAAQVHPHIQQRLNKTYGLPFDYGKPDRMLEEFAQQHGISFLKLMPLFLEYHLKTGKYLHGFGSGDGGHWNENGHCLAAEKIFEFLQANHLVPLASLQGRAHADRSGVP
jgi:lysophospholipase L1-like esterase